MNGILSMLLTLTLLAGCSANTSTITRPVPADESPNVSGNAESAPVIDITGSYSVETEELYAENEGQQI